MTRLSPRYPLCSDRLRLRPFGIDDVTSLVACRSNPEVCRYVPFEPMDPTTMLKRVPGSWSRSHLDAEGQSLVLGIELAAEGCLVGDVPLRGRRRSTRALKLAVCSIPHLAVRGSPAEAAHRMIHLAFDDLGLHRIVARVVAGNLPSIRVALCTPYAV
jgi:RimJ/RimL family protein N-acetyltransferase